jgi:hypothetical protein
MSKFIAIRYHGAMLKKLILGFLGTQGIILDRYIASREVNHALGLLRPLDSGHKLIRLGSSNDGGYLLPDVLEGISACFSPGVSTNSSFELSLAERGINCFLADYSISELPQQHEMFDFVKKHLDSFSSDKTLTLSEWMKAKSPIGDLLLQMDIEGSEYAVISSATLEDLKRFRIIILELHEFDSIVTTIGKIAIKNALDRLLVNHSIVHVHANNYGTPRKFQGKFLPRAIEITLLRKDFIKTNRIMAKLPNKLDQPNSLIYPDLVLDDSWFS